eukprot:Lithocolla_globosa_v1_NODE_96_length_6498_cov_20.614310.p4 type:complete len:228 gc:universal NODE_96_length_6498_cov_20.614310:978-1661(+)
MIHLHSLLCSLILERMNLLSTLVKVHLEAIFDADGKILPESQKAIDMEEEKTAELVGQFLGANFGFSALHPSANSVNWPLPEGQAKREHWNKAGELKKMKMECEHRLHDSSINTINQCLCHNCSDYCLDYVKGTKFPKSTDESGNPLPPKFIPRECRLGYGPEKDPNKDHIVAGVRTWGKVLHECSACKPNHDAWRISEQQRKKHNEDGRKADSKFVDEPNPPTSIL